MNTKLLTLLDALVEVWSYISITQIPRMLCMGLDWKRSVFENDKKRSRLDSVKCSDMWGFRRVVVKVLGRHHCAEELCSDSGWYDQYYLN